jgi:hypothetical protein
MVFQLRVLFAVLLAVSAQSNAQSDSTVMRMPGNPTTNEYHIQIKTGGKLGSGVKGKVFIQFGDDIHSPAQSLLETGAFGLRRNTKRTFIVQSSEHFDDVCSLVVGNPNSGAFSNWFLEYVQISDGQRTWVFPVNSWINDKNPAGIARLNINRCGRSNLEAAKDHEHVETELVTDNTPAGPPTGPPPPAQWKPSPGDPSPPPPPEVSSGAWDPSVPLLPAGMGSGVWGPYPSQPDVWNPSVPLLPAGMGSGVWGPYPSQPPIPPCPDSIPPPSCKSIFS